MSSSLYDKAGKFLFSSSSTRKNCKFGGLILKQKPFWVLLGFHAMIGVDRFVFKIMLVENRVSWNNVIKCLREKLK